MRILRAENYRRMRWKNGGGETAEIAVFPEGAGLDDFGWRVSMARVGASGPFSVFSGVERTLSILEGEGMTLDIEGRKPVTLTSASAPHSFPADAATKAELLGSPIVDLNVMTRRGRYQHRVTRCEVAGRLELTVGVDEAIILSTARLRIGGQGFEEELGLYDTLMATGLQHPFSAEGQGQLFLIELKKSN